MTGKVEECLGTARTRTTADANAEKATLKELLKVLKEEEQKRYRRYYP